MNMHTNQIANIILQYLHTPYTYVRLRMERVPLDLCALKIVQNNQTTKASMPAELSKYNAHPLFGTIAKLWLLSSDASYSIQLLVAADHANAVISCPYVLTK